MSGIRKGVLLGAIQIALVLSLGGKLLYDRMTRPRAWVLCAAYDPELPIRGRYLSEQLHLPAEGFKFTELKDRNSSYWTLKRQWAYWEVRDGQLVAKSQGSGPGGWVRLRKNGDGAVLALSEDIVLVFIPDRAEIPSLKPGQEMWVEVTVPKRGPPRPIRIGIKKDGVITPLKLS